MKRAGYKVVYVEMLHEEHAQVARLAAESGALAGHPVSMADVVRQLVRDAARRGTPVRVRERPNAP